MAKKKVLLDTDIGTDVDDAVCLAYLLANPDCELLGITTVTGEANLRAELASVLCKAAGRDIPIFPGAQKPLMGLQKQPIAQQAAALDRWPHDTFDASNALPAIQFMSRTIRENPGEIELISIGPLTNLGLLFAVDPEVPALLKSLTMMAGYYGVGSALEWNAVGDAYATAIVYQAEVAVHRSIGLNVTRHVYMSADQVREKFRADLLKPVLDFAEIWFKDWGGITFHDPLAAATLFDDQICQFERGTIIVELEDGAIRGKTYWLPGAFGKRHEIAVDVDPDRFFEHFFSVFS